MSEQSVNDPHLETSLRPWLANDATLQMAYVWLVLWSMLRLSLQAHDWKSSIIWIQTREFGPPKDVYLAQSASGQGRTQVRCVDSADCRRMNQASEFVGGPIQTKSGHTPGSTPTRKCMNPGFSFRSQIFKTQISACRLPEVDGPRVLDEPKLLWCMDGRICQRGPIFMPGRKRA